MKVPAVNIEIADDGRAYTVTATPWPAIDGTGHSYTARLIHTVSDLGAFGTYPTSWTDRKLAKFVKALMATYPKATV